MECWRRVNNPKMKTSAGVAMLASAVGLYLSGSRSTLLLVFALLIGWVIWATPKLRGWRRAIPLSAADRGNGRGPLDSRSRLSRHQLCLAERETHGMDTRDHLTSCFRIARRSGRQRSACILRFPSSDSDRERSTD